MSRAKFSLAPLLPSPVSRWTQFRRLAIPDWLWQLTWLRKLPAYHRAVRWEDCTRSKLQVYLDLLYIFFKLRTVPEHYGPCKLWQRPRKDWILYSGSPYTPIQWGNIANKIYPYDYCVLYNDKFVGACLSKSLPIRQPANYGLVQPVESLEPRLARAFEESGERVLVLKPVFGRSGIGVQQVAKTDDGRIVIRSASGQDIPINSLQLKEPAFLQKVVRQHPSIAAIWNSSVNTMRIIHLQTLDGEMILLGAGMRFGVGQSLVDNWSAGGIAIGLDAETGRLRRFGTDRAGVDYEKHPSSGVPFEGFQIPNWPRLLEAARQVQRELNFSKVMGLDMAIDEDGEPVLIEMNGLPDWMAMEQRNGPLLANPRVLKAFAEYGILAPGPQRRLGREVESAREKVKARIS